MSREVWEGGVLRRRDDDTTKTTTLWDATGTIISATPYSPAEAAAVDAMIAAGQVAAEAQQRQAAAEAVLDATLALMTQAHADDEPWKQPTGTHDAYPAAATVTHNGHRWVSLVAANVWQPGISGWRQLDAGAPDWRQPTGWHDAYSWGDRVTHNGQLWESTVLGIQTNTWEPGVYGWIEVTE